MWPVTKQSSTTTLSRWHIKLAISSLFHQGEKRDRLSKFHKVMHRWSAEDKIWNLGGCSRVWILNEHSSLIQSSHLLFAFQSSGSWEKKMAFGGFMCPLHEVPIASCIKDFNYECFLKCPIIEGDQKKQWILTWHKFKDTWSVWMRPPSCNPFSSERWRVSDTNLRVSPSCSAAPPEEGTMKSTVSISTVLSR